MRVFRTKIRQLLVSELVQWVVSFLALESRLVFWRCERFLDLDSREEVVEAVEAVEETATAVTRAEMRAEMDELKALILAQKTHCCCVLS